MRKRLDNWLNKDSPDLVSVDTIQRICQALEQDVESCWAILHSYDLGQIDEAEMLQGLALVTGKSVPEVDEAIKLALAPSSPGGNQ